MRILYPLPPGARAIALAVQLQEFPVLSSLTISGSVLRGHNVTGWTLGVGASF